MRYQLNFKVSLLLFMLGSLFMEASAQLVPPGAYTHIAVNSGNWNNPLTWGGALPNDGAIVQIPSGIRVTLTSQEAARVRYLQVEGEFRHSVHVNTRLLVETIFITDGGLFRIGTPSNPVKPNRSAEIVFINDGNPIDTLWDPNLVSRGMVSLGMIRIYGKTKTNMMAMPNDARSGSSDLVTNNTVPADWAATDEIVLTGTHFLRGTDSQDEKVSISGINGNVIDINGSLQYNHIRANNDMNLHIANLSRNVIFRSESTTPAALRAHIMIRNSDTDIRYAAFLDLGRTDKFIPLNELKVNRFTQMIEPGANTNRRGRYSLHFHLNGLQPNLPEPPTKVYGCVVTNAIGWGYVNHGSHVDFQNNVCYNFVGSAFVTEFGDELGNFYNNIAIKGTGNGEYRPIRVVFGNGLRPQAISDFGFSGDGFWFQGPAIRVRNNVAAGCNGAGMIWFTTGAVDISTNTYVGFPTSAIPAAYAGFPGIGSIEYRTWAHATNEAVTSDLPILECKNFEAYGCLTGFRLRFNNNTNISFYSEEWFGYENAIVPVPGHTSINYANRLYQEVDSLKLWNNEQGFRMRYSSKTNWKQVEVINRQAYDPVLPYAATEFHHQVFDNQIDDLTIDGYAVAGWVIDNDVDNSNEVVVNSPTYLNYANADTWKDTAFCADITGLSVPLISASAARVTWNSHPSANRILLRFKRNGEDYWSYKSDTIHPGITTIGISGLLSGQTYQIQALAGCPNTVSQWSNPVSFNTLVPPVASQGGSKPLYEVRLYPNPSEDGQVHVAIPKGLHIYQAQVFDLQGRLIAYPDLQQLREGILELGMSKSSGVIVLNLDTNDGIKSLRIIRQ